MDNNNFNNDPNNTGAQNNNDYSAPQPSNPYQYNGNASTDTTAQSAGSSFTYGQQSAADTQNASQNPYGTAPQNPYDTTAQNPYDAAAQNPYDTTAQNPYGAANQNPYGTAAQNPYANTYNAYGSASAAPLDKNGQPMKNNYSMKLAFSILEIISVLACNILGLIMGILGCVFSSKANAAYKEGRWEDFKSAAKNATIVLWVGFAGVIIAVIAWIVIFATGIWALNEIGNVVSDYDDYNYDYNYDYNVLDDNDDDDDYTYDYNDPAEDDGNDDYDDNGNGDQPSGDVTIGGDIDFEDTVVYDSNGVVVTATSITFYEDYSGNQYPQINVVINNGSDSDVTVSVEYLSINGIVMDYPSLYQSVTAGLSAKAYIDCSYSDAYLYADFDTLEYFTVCLNVYDNDYNDYSDYYDFFTVDITGEFNLYGPDDSTLLLSQDGFDIYYLGTYSDSYYGDEFVFFVVNNNDLYVHVNTDDLAVDGFMQSYGYDSEYIYTYDGALFFVECDDDVDINNVSSASIKFESYDMTTWNDVLETGSVSFIQ